MIHSPFCHSFGPRLMSETWELVIGVERKAVVGN